jgi:transposase InsO family protein
VAYRLIAAQKASPDAEIDLDVVRMSTLLGVSRSGYYAWRGRTAGPPRSRAARREDLRKAVLAAHAASDGVNGAPRITADLRAAGQPVNRKTVAKLMAELHIQGISPRPWRTTTIPDPDADRHPDLVERAFDSGRLDAVWISDITYLATRQGWLYLAVVRDACSRRVLGWAIEDHQRAELVTQALAMAVAQRGRDRPDRVVFHADRGSQYTSRAVLDFATAHGLACSVGATGVCWDNAMAESFWASLKVEFYYRRTWPTKTAARRAVIDWITQTYNARRRHSALGMQTPLQFELHKRRVPLAA